MKLGFKSSALLRRLEIMLNYMTYELFCPEASTIIKNEQKIRKSDMRITVPVSNLSTTDSALRDV